MTLTSLIERHLIDPTAGWSVGSFGAIAEFTHDPGEAVRFARDRGLSAVTPRGGIRLDPLPAVRPVPYETPGRLAGQWNHAIALCLHCYRKSDQYILYTQQRGSLFHQIDKHTRAVCLNGGGRQALFVLSCVQFDFHRGTSRLPIAGV